MSKRVITYDAAIQELEAIVKNIETGGVMGMSEYTKQAKRATELIQICTEKLRAVDAELNDIFEQK